MPKKNPMTTDEAKSYADRILKEFTLDPETEAKARAAIEAELLAMRPDIQLVAAEPVEQDFVRVYSHGSKKEGHPEFLAALADTIKRIRPWTFETRVGTIAAKHQGLNSLVTAIYVGGCIQLEGGWPTALKISKKGPEFKGSDPDAHAHGDTICFRDHETTTDILDHEVAHLVTMSMVRDYMARLESSDWYLRINRFEHGRFLRHNAAWRDLMHFLGHDDHVANIKAVESELLRQRKAAAAARRAAK